MTVQHDSNLERDLGIDSLARVELLTRLERSFGVRLSEDSLMQAETAADLLQALRTASPKTVAEPVWAPATPTSPVSAPEHAQTLLDVLQYHSEAHGDRTHIHLIGAKNEVWTVSYEQLWHGARDVAAGLLDHDLPPASAVAIMLPTGESFFEVFLGVLLAGCVPLPIYPPVRRTQIEEHLRRQAGILANANVPILVTTPGASTFAALIRAQVASVQAVVTVAGLKRDATFDIKPQVNRESLALLQYTSGSTGDPKGVMLTHGNLLANIRALGDALKVTSHDVVVSWLPLYHDMGLIGTWLGSLYYGCPFVVMSPLTFLARPERWLRAISRFRGTLSAAPNFAYGFLLTKVADRDLDGLDLSSWRMACNGAERVSRSTIEAFAERYAPYGFRAEAMTPMYGLAESSVALTTSPLGRGPRFDRILRDELESSGRAVPSHVEDRRLIDIVSCGLPLIHHEIRVVDDSGRELGDRQEGAIQFRGPSATQGYLNAPDKTAALFNGGWLDSGDKGYLAQGELYVTGRIKDIIVRAGRNLYPDEVEDAIGDLDGIRKGQVAVFASEDPKTATERLVVLAESRQVKAEARERLRSEVVRLVSDLIDSVPDDVQLVRPGTVLKTPNGKVRRAACRELYEAGRLGRPPPAFWQQIIGLLQASLRPQLRRWAQATSALLFALYFQALYRIFAPIVFLGVLLVPSLALRRRLFRFAARLMLCLAGLRPAVHGLENLPTATPYVIVANHGSFLDGLVLAAALPVGLAFVAKRELVEGPIAGSFLKRLGTVFVERFDPIGGIESAGDMARALTAGEVLVVFAEGTFDRRPGLRAFHIGGFTSASQLGVAVVPVGIAGTRSVLRGTTWFARRGEIAVSVGSPLLPRGEDWNAAIALRDETRLAVLHLCGEPDLIGEPTAI